MEICTDELVTICILVYRNYQYIYTALESVFFQDYSNIELIISDDGSDNFPLQEIEKFVEQNSKDNIKKVIINIEEKNLGTVKHLNKLISMSKGTYFIALAGDDAFFDSTIISHYVENFQKNPNYLIQIAQTAMYDINLEKIEYYYCPPDIIELINNNQYENLLARIMEFPYFPTTSTCYTKKLFEKVGNFDEQYFIIEDLPLHIKLLKKKVPILFDNFLAIKHRDGGISHSEGQVLSESKKKYYLDSLKIYSSECLPYAKHSKDSDKIERIQQNIFWIEKQLSNTFLKKMVFIFKHPLKSFKIFLQNKRCLFLQYAKYFFGTSGLFYFLFPLSKSYFSKEIWSLFQEYAYSFSLFLFLIGVFLLGFGLIGDKLLRWEYFAEFKMTN